MNKPAVWNDLVKLVLPLVWCLYVQQYGIPLHLVLSFITTFLKNWKHFLAKIFPFEKSGIN